MRTLLSFASGSFAPMLSAPHTNVQNMVGLLLAEELPRMTSVSDRTGDIKKRGVQAIALCGTSPLDVLQTHIVLPLEVSDAYGASQALACYRGQ